MRRTVLLAVLTVGALLVGAGPAVAAPPPVDPGDRALTRSGAQVGARAAEVGRLTARLAELDAAFAAWVPIRRAVNSCSVASPSA